ncbi:MAG TPA: HlyD family efflux transporter periplasmic adaptor subunit [Vicinamibacterales bacterium]
MRRAASVLLVLALGVSGAVAHGTDQPDPARLRLHGTIEPLRSFPIATPRLAGTGNGNLVIVHLAQPGTLVKRGDLLIEFDRQTQIKNARDREAEFRDLVEQINRKHGEQLVARAKDDTELFEAESAVKSAELDLVNREFDARTVVEHNELALEEARAKVAQLRRTLDLKRKADAADLRLLEIQRDRAQNAWRHAEQNATKMRIVSPMDGLVVLKATWKNGSMGEVQEGEEVRPGLPLLEVVDPSAMRVRARINQADIDYIQPGATAQIRLDSYPSKLFRGRLEQLSPIGATSNMSQRVRTFVAFFSIEGSDPHLLPDLAAAVEIGEPALRVVTGR